MSHNPKGGYALRSFVVYASRFKLQFIVVGTLFLLSNVLIAIIPIFIGMLIGELAGNPDTYTKTAVYVGILVACSTFHDIIWRLAEIAYLRFILPLAYKYETVLFRQVIHKPYPYFVDKFTGKLASYISTLSQEMRALTEALFYNYLYNIIGLITMAFILSSINLQTGIIFAASLLVMFIVGRFSVRNSLKYEKIAADSIATKNGLVIDAVANFVNVKSFQKENFELSRMLTEQNKVIRDTSKSFAWSIFFWGTMSLFVRHLIWPVTIILNVYLYTKGQVSVEQLATLLSAVLLFSATIWDIIWQLSQFNLKISRVEEAHRYLFGNAFIEFDAESHLDTKVPEFEKTISFKNLSFAYPDRPDRHVLHDINLEIKHGEKIGIVGKSGGGKSTITKIMLGYYDVKDGIELDGKQVDTKHLARIISYVPQDTPLFHRSVADNIAYAANGNPTREEITTAAQHAHAHEFIQNITDGYDALVGERGVKLSIGQRQRIAIARAFLDDKPVLVLDEATSALDSESEVLIQDALEDLWQDKTVIAIAHRLSTLRNMDRILVIEHGTIQEEGTHKELLALNGAYAKLWSHQSGGFIEE